MSKSKSSFADKLEHLFETIRKPDGSQYTQAEVIEGTGDVLTRVYLWKLRTGRASNPGFHILKAIADFFGVDPNYFFDGEETAIDEEKTKPREKYMQEIQTRAYQMDERGRKAILDMMDYILTHQKGESPGDASSGSKPSGEEDTE
jgi:transcriptional regulator with XRE-family HTH domain